MDQSLQTQFYDSPNGRDILRCIQCGACSGSCPYAHRMVQGPRQIFALIRDGHMSDVFASETPWFCSSCYQCMDRCPMEIPVTDIMYTLKQMAFEKGRTPAGNKMADLYRAFSRNVEMFGRVTDPLVMAGYSIKHPLDAVKSIPLALKLVKRGRLELVPQKTAQKDILGRKTGEEG